MASKKELFLFLDANASWASDESFEFFQQVCVNATDCFNKEYNTNYDFFDIQQEYMARYK